MGRAVVNVLELSPGVLVLLRLWRLDISLRIFTICQVIRKMCSYLANEMDFFVFVSFIGRLCHDGLAFRYGTFRLMLVW